MLSQPVINSVMKRTAHLQIDKVNVVKNLSNELDEDGIINLKILRLSNGGLEYLIDTRKSIPTGTFGKLELLELVRLPDLIQICNGNLSRMEHIGRGVSEPQLFCNLKNLYICGCASKNSRMVSALERNPLQDGYVSYPWKRRKQEMLSVSNSNSFYSILFLPKATDKVAFRYNNLEDTLARAQSWINAYQDSGVPVVFMNIQTESLLTKENWKKESKRKKVQSFTSDSINGDMIFNNGPFFM
ncbi:hypothetical protein Adt_40294 [Abeliophyllum distichum]|uniref:Uncharacterized protein n=1 Tax=Abeliophyllum distichum TaxID=126358 RepID=A0ABD1Q7J7_9LAMI